MAIAFDLTENSLRSQAHYRKMGIEQMRPVSRQYDEQ